MGEVLTMAEIEERYPDQWVLIDEPEVDDNQDVIAGVVVGAGDDADEVLRLYADRIGDEGAILFIGEDDFDVGYMLGWARPVCRRHAIIIT